MYAFARDEPTYPHCRLCPRCTPCLWWAPQLVKFIEETANSHDMAPVDLKAGEIKLTRDDENKYPLLSGKPVANIKLRVAIFQVRRVGHRPQSRL